MSLNFFKKEPQKTDASLSYDTIINSLRHINKSATPLNVDKFIQAENIDLRQHQEFYKNIEKKASLPISLEKENNKYTVNDTRELTNSLIDISKTSATTKEDISALKNTAEISSIENKKTMDKINTINKTF